MSEMDRDALRDWLLAKNIPFQRHAHLDQLRELYGKYSQQGTKNTPLIALGNAGSPTMAVANVAAVADDSVADDSVANVAAVADDCVTNIAARVDNAAEEEAALDVELRILEKRRRIAELRRELTDSVDLDSALSAPVPRPTFNDIQHAVIAFSGSDIYDANKWLADFERACASIDGDDTFRLKCIRRLMKPDTDAELFLRTDSSTTYAEFRQNFLQNFGHVYSVSEVIEKLNNTKFRPSEMSVMGYILKMQEIASRAHVDEKHTVRCIIDGFRDKSVHVAALYPAKNLRELKELARTYEHLRDQSALSASVSAHRLKGVVKPESNKDVQCYNCSGRGHMSAACPMPKRAIGSCFRCGSTGHKISSCRIPAGKEVALLSECRERGDVKQYDAVDNLCESLSSINEVSVAFSCDDGDRHSNTFVSLFDTGSPISLIRVSEVPAYLIAGPKAYSGYQGLGNTRLYTHGRIKISVEFRSVFKNLKIFVVPNSFIPYPVVLGRDFLDIFNIELTIIKCNDNVNKRPGIATKYNEVKRDKVLHCLFPSLQNDLSQLSVVVTSNRPMVYEGTACETSTRALSDAQVPAIFAIEIEKTADKFDINPNLSAQDKAMVRDLIISNYLNADFPAIKHEYKMQIRLNSDIPINFAPRRLSYADKQIVEKNVDELLNLGFIRPSESPYAFPLVLVAKKDGSKRQCVDYRALNKITIRDSYPIPLIDDCLERLEGKRVFTTIDLKNGFHHVKVSEESTKYTAFVTPNGHYEYTVMPFGLKNGPMIFQRFINFVLAEFIREGSVVVYLDDVTLATKSLTEHFNLLKRVLRRLAEFRLQIQFNKCQFCYYNISLLGFEISSKGVLPNNKHIRAITNLPYPKNIGEVQKCLGLFSYFRRFIPSYSSASQPLRDLVKPDRPFEFDERRKKIFDNLREKLVSSPVLALYNPNRETELHCDASSMGFGAILFQRQDDQKLHPIAYFSKSSTPSESKYHSFEIETLAIIYALRKFRIYLEGIPFRIITDCNSLAMTLNRKSINARIARWALELENYNYTIQHRSGSLMGHVDALSRFHFTPVSESDMPKAMICSLQADDIDVQLSITQGRDRNIVELREKLENGPVEGYTLEDGLLYRVTKKGKLLLYVPKEMEDQVVRHAHERTCHMGISKCVDQIKLHYWFSNMQEKVERFIRNCLKCIMFSVPNHSHNRTLHHIPKKPVPFDTVHLDHFGPLPSIVSKRKHILLVVDAFTKYVKLFPVNSTSTKEVCASLDKYIEFYSRPRRVITDRGSSFTSNEFNSYLIENNIEHVKIATASPQANGQVERVNRVLKAMLAKTSEPIQHSDWSKMLTRVEYALNNSIHSVTKYTPSQLLFGVTQRGRDVDSLSEYLDDKHSLSGNQNPAIMRNEASNNIRRQQDKSTHNHAGKVKPHDKFTPGDFVAIRNIDTSIGTNKKFVPKFRGPYIIHKVLPNDRYVIRDIENNPYSQKPYDGILEASRIRHWADWRDSHKLTKSTEQPPTGIS